MRATETIVERLFAEEKGKAQNLATRLLGSYPSDEYDSEDIFTEALTTVYEKYLMTGEVVELDRARNLLYGCVRIGVSKFKKLHYNEVHTEFTDGDVSDVQLLPPTHYVTKEYNSRPEVRERRQVWQKTYYLTNHAKMLAREQDKTRKAARNKIASSYYYRMKQDPERYAEYLTRANARLKRNRADKAAGRFVDGRTTCESRLTHARMKAGDAMPSDNRKE